MKPNILVICGPTASGKTALSVALARRFGGEVVSADSMQVYRGMDIGTAKPTAEEMQGVPHHMLDVADPGENYSVARYVADAVPIVDDILRRGRLPVVAGGTGLYIDNLIAGRRFAPFEADSGLRRQLQEQVKTEGLPALRRQLEQADPEAAERIDRRVDEMMARGLEGEVRRLLADGVPQDCTAMQAIGYKEIAAAILEGRPVSQGAEEVKLRTRQYAKRQLTWFRRNQSAHWFEWEKIPDFSAALAFSTELVTGSGLQ